MTETAVGRYLRLLQKSKPNHRPNKRVRKAANAEVRALLHEGFARDAAAIQAMRDTARQQQMVAADTLYGAQKFGRDVTQPLVIPAYREPLPRVPEHGFGLIYRLFPRPQMHLWADGAWVGLSGELLREVGSSGLRVTLAQACVFQEQRKWRSDAHRLNFRDCLWDAQEGVMLK